MPAASGATSSNAINRLLSGPFGSFILKPWYDPLALQGIVRVFMPSSRAWAAANVADGDLSRFQDELRRPRALAFGLDKPVGETARRAAAYRAAEQAWQEAVRADAEPGDLVALEDHRMISADAWMRTRASFVPAHLMRPFPAVRFDIEPVAAVTARHGARLSDVAAAFPLGEAADGFTASRHCQIHGRALSWVRFPTGPFARETHGWARIEEPRAGAARGAVIFCHGIMMEREHWAALYDQAEVFLDTEGGALAVISPEGPGHGRRMAPGYYGGEPILAHGMGGILDYFGAHVVEIGRLVAWARARYGGPVAVAGVSLGALTTQLVLSAARHWPAAARPDAALLLATNESLVDVTFNGSLAGGLGFPAALHAAGWTDAEVDRWRPLVEPGDSALAPERIVCVLGTTDTVTPYGGGERLAARWGLPAGNVFRWHGGHFAAAFSVLRDRTPIHRFKQAMAA